ncbi:hypothetical protein F0562_035621 [Nyssa sinensis]|uniref:dihydrolipoyllysine-residue succinyltransferase n=1 Tax=Nyssa sinensis TaxID=561372 RepID=A0A5J5ADB2_9ASTE|nr:hypothetical protein F0562_035621 [Nyssa sinensis]
MKLCSDYTDAFVEKHGVKLGLMLGFVKAAVSGLHNQPIINAVIDGDDIIYRDYIDISIDVGTPEKRNKSGGALLDAIEAHGLNSESNGWFGHWLWSPRLGEKKAIEEEAWLGADVEQPCVQWRRGWSKLKRGANWTKGQRALG